MKRYCQIFGDTSEPLNTEQALANNDKPSNSTKLIIQNQTDLENEYLSIHQCEKSLNDRYWEKYF